MTRSINLQKKITARIVVSLILSCFALLCQAWAVTPPPDGGYPNGNTAEGLNALLKLTTGTYNTAIGILSLSVATTGNYNTAVGAGALALNNADGNTAIGVGALLSNTTGVSNTANGIFALFSNTGGIANTAGGSFALAGNTTGHQNTAFGAGALSNNSGGSGNTANGAEALNSNTTGVENTATGTGALQFNDTGMDNTANGVQSLFNNASGAHNTAIGAFALHGDNVADDNTAVGATALVSSTGRRNTAVGSGAGSSLTTGDNNIDIGYNVQGLAGEANTIRIGNTDITTTVIRGISGQTIPNGTAVFVASNGQLGTMTSSKRYKDDIKPMDKLSEMILALRPVTFRYKREIDPDTTPQFGLVAEDVAKVNKDLVIRDRNGEPYTVRYDAVNAMLLNEFLKEHKAFVEEQHKMQEQGASIARLQTRIEALTAALQKVSAQLEISKPAPQTVLNSP